MTDTRSAAFLREMGIDTLWVLREAPAPAEVLPAAPESTDPVARMDWAALRAAVAGCQRCGLCKSGKAPVMGEGAEQAQWLVVAGPAMLENQQAGSVLAGDAGRLLHNMLFAAGQVVGEGAYVTHLVKCRPATSSGADRAPTSEEIAACRPYLERELVLSGAHTILALGQQAANGVLNQAPETPLSDTRGQVHALGRARVVASLRPQDLLQDAPAKAQAWTDLCRANDGQGG